MAFWCMTISILLTLTHLSNCSGENAEVGSCPAKTQCWQDQDCPVWYKCDNSTCVCQPSHFIRCDPTKPVAQLLDGYCMTVKWNGSETLAGACFSNTGSGSLDDTFYRNLMKNRTEQNSFMCGSTHHDGDLCGRCEDGHYLMAYSYNLSCVRCENAHRNWLLYFAVGYGPLTLFYFLVVFFKLSVNTSSLHGFIFVSQAFSMPAYTRLILHSTRGTTQTSMKVLSALYGIWNLDFVRAFTTGICLKIDSLSILALDYGIAVFPLLLTLLSYCLIELHDRNFRVIVFIWKPFRHLLMLFRHNWNSRTSVVDAYSTFFTLSYIKLLNVSFDMLVPTRVYMLGSSETYLALYYDATKEYLKREHLYYAVLAMLVLFFFNILPVIVLSFYQFKLFRRVLCCLPVRQDIFNTFIDSFQGCFKNGTEPGTRDCRWFSATYFLLRVIGFITFAILPNVMYFVFAALLLLIFAVALVAIQPYHSSKAHHMAINTSFIVLLVFVYMSITGMSLAVATNVHFKHVYLLIAKVTCSLPLVCISVYVAQWLFTRRRFGCEIVSRIKALRAGYEWWSLAGDSLPHRMTNPSGYVQQ